MPGPTAPATKGKLRNKGATGSLRRAFVGVALATCIPFLLLLAYLAWGQISRERNRVEQDAFAQASLLSAQVEKHVGARIEASPARQVCLELAARAPRRPRRRGAA